MKKVFSIFMIFFAVFLVSCGGLLGEDSTNTVRITMPGNARSASAGGPEDVDYYNIQIASQSFSIVPPGSTVESDPLPVGMSVSISVEAIGKIKENGQDVDSGRRVAYYQTSERLPAEGLTLNVNMANYKTEYHKVTLEPNGFNGQQTQEVYVAGGSRYILPNYGPSLSSSGGAPQKHTGWTYDQTGKVAAGGSITINSDMTFMLETGDDDSYARITFSGAIVLGNFETINIWKSEDYVKKGTSYELPDYSGYDYYRYLEGAIHGASMYTASKHSGWTSGTQSYKPGQTIQNIHGDMNFTIVAIESTAIAPETGTSFTEPLPEGIYRLANRSGQYSPYIIWSGESFTVPTGTKQDGSNVTAWELRDTNGAVIKTLSSGDSVTYAECQPALETGTTGYYLRLYPKTD